VSTAKLRRSGSGTPCSTTARSALTLRRSTTARRARLRPDGRRVVSAPCRPRAASRIRRATACLTLAIMRSLTRSGIPAGSARAMSAWVPRSRLPRMRGGRRASNRLGHRTRGVLLSARPSVPRYSVSSAPESGACRCGNARRCDRRSLAWKPEHPTSVGQTRRRLERCRPLTGTPALGVSGSALDFSGSRVRA
jgi:hypothetical protein